MREQKETFADITAEFIGKPYSETGIGPDEYNCIGFCYAFLKRTGKPVDDNVWLNQKINAANYMKWRNKEAKKTVEWLMDVFNKIGIEVSPSKVMAGDFVAWQDKNNRLHPGIYGGNRQILTAIRDKGVSVIALNKETIKIVKGRRL